MITKVTGPFSSQGFEVVLLCADLACHRQRCRCLPDDRPPARLGVALFADEFARTLLQLSIPERYLRRINLSLGAGGAIRRNAWRAAKHLEGPAFAIRFMAAESRARVLVSTPHRGRFRRPRSDQTEGNPLRYLSESMR